jgi:hypothetical protein
MPEALRKGLNVNLERRRFIGGSDARIIMGEDENALFRLWREKRGEAEPEDLSGNLIVQLGLATEELNRRRYEANSGQAITGHPAAGPPSCGPLDGRHPGRQGRSNWGGFRGKIHAALVIFGRSRRREAYGAAAA